jgi:sulfide:quinone oxidoreductase
MKNLLILGAGTAGTLIVNKIEQFLDSAQWQITIVDRSATHYYQPGFVFIPFGIYQPEQVLRNKQDFLPKSVHFIVDTIQKIDPHQRQVLLASGQALPYDYLIVATGAALIPEDTEGLTGELWQKDIFDFYTFRGAVALASALKTWQGGKLVVNIADVPIKGPAAPLEFLFMADDFFKQRGMRSKVSLHLVTPLPDAFISARVTAELSGLLASKQIAVTTDFRVARVDNERKVIVAWDDREVPFDLLVTVPAHRGDAAIQRSGLGDELNFFPVNKHTLRSLKYDNIFGIGDAASLPTAKVGSAAHFETDVLAENILNAIEGVSLKGQFDGHANYFVETGHDRGLAVDYNYDTEPVPGTFPLPAIGPFSLLKESYLNHLGKMTFRHVYWDLLMSGHELPLITSQMTLSGKALDE